MKQEVCEKVFQTIQKQKLIDWNDNVVAGVSGGPDSVCLLHVLFCLKERLGIRGLAAVHVNHMYRGQEALRDEAYTRDFCQSLGIPCYVYRKDILAISRREKISGEEAGRKVRYEAFREVLRAMGGAGKIAVAHHGDDQAETILMRIIRGTGIDGLGGMAYKREDQVIRPLLDLRRREIEAYCREKALSFVTDHTNLQPIYTRNRIRLELLPMIENITETDFCQSLNHLGKVAREDRDFIQGFVQQVLQEGRREQDQRGGERIVFSLACLRKLHPSVRKRVFLAALSELGLEEGAGSSHLAQAESICLNVKPVGEAEFPHQYHIKKYYDKVICEKKREMAEDLPYTYVLEEEETLLLREAGVVAESRIIDHPGQVEALKKSWFKRDRKALCQYLDADKGAGVLEIRNRRGGETFSPLGFSGTKKLKAYLSEKKIPPEKRGRIPLFCRGNRVLWIPGLGIDDKVKIHEGTRRIRVLRIEQTGKLKT